MRHIVRQVRVHFCRKCGKPRSHPLRYVASVPVCEHCYQTRDLPRIAPPNNRCQNDGCGKYAQELYETPTGKKRLCRLCGDSAVMVPRPKPTVPEPLRAVPRRDPVGTFRYREPGEKLIEYEVVTEKVLNRNRWP